MDPLDLALNGVLPPLLVALLLVGLGGGRWLGAALALGTLFAYARLAATQDQLAKWPQWPPADGRQGLVLAICLGGLVSLLPERLPRQLRLGLGLAACAATVPLLLWRSSWPFAGKLAVAPCLALLWWAASQIGQRHPAKSACAAWCACFSACAIVLLPGSQLIAQMPGAAAAVLGTAAFLAIWRRFQVGAQASLPIALAFGGWLCDGQASTDPNPAAMLCALLAPLGMLLGSTGSGGRGPWLAYGTTALLALAAVGIALPAVLRDVG